MNAHGHSTAVEALCWNSDASQLASGGDDTDIVVWDSVSYTSLFRLRGHKGAVTGLAFLNKVNALLSCSKDMLVKIWELETQHCIQTLVGTRREIYSLALNPSVCLYFSNIFITLFYSQILVFNLFF